MQKNPTFLGELASKIIENNAIPLEKILVILPNKRAKRVLQKEIALLINKPHFSPTILTISEFIESLSPFKAISKEELLLQLYDCFISLDSFKEETFQKFLSWGPIFLSDINEIDLQLAPTEHIFVNLSEAKEIDTSFLKGELSDNQIIYLRFYQQLYSIYSEFSSRLQNQKKGYAGMVFRSVAEQLSKTGVDDPEILNNYKNFQRFIFAGFHALSPSEMAILEFFYHRFHVEFLFDIDHFYDTQYTPFVKTLQNNLRIPDIHIKDQFREIPKEVFITEVSGNMTQIYHAIEILEEIEQKEGNLDQTVLVFGDESLVVPFVHAYDCSKANLTMGYPIQNTTAYQLLKLLIRLTKNAQRFSNLQNSSQPIYYHKDIISFLQNPLIINTVFGGSDKANQVINNLIFNNQVFISKKDLPPIIPQLPFEGIIFVEELRNFILGLSKKTDSKSTDFKTIEILLDKMDETIQFLQQYQNLEKITDISSMEYFIFEKIDGVTIPFIGDFDKGLQVCGLLETRTLDYKNVIFLSINEGVLPKGKSQPSLILFDIKNYFNLPTSTYKDSIFAYHFFRLMQRAQLIHILYDNDSSSSLAEKSRFISQLEFEVDKQKLTQSIHITKRAINTPTKPRSIENLSITIHKDERIMNELMRLNYSPSSLSTFISCPLAFYLSQVEKIEAPESIDESIENKVIGSIIHEVLETIFEEIRVQPLKDVQILDHYLKDLDSTVQHFFKKNRDLQNADISKGKIYLATEIVKKNLFAYLQMAKEEFKNSTLEVKGNEVQLISSLETGYGTIQLKGKIDRVDVRDGAITILDYKTGKVDAKKLDFIDPETILTDSDQKQLFQLFMYLYLYLKDQSEKTTLKTQIYRAGIVSFQEVLLKNEDFIQYAKLSLGKKEKTIDLTQEFIQDWETILKQLIERILDPKEPFQQTEEQSHCIYCDFNAICRKGLTEKSY
jgi:CRISPR/Cas system-associated exonuclease Cas4 (RecB family)